jgi:acetyl-CoA C-acetyltransferase
MTALRLGYRAIRSGEADVAIACGAENMGNACHLVEAKNGRWGKRLGHIQMTDILFELGYGKKGFNPVALDAGEVALEFEIDRTEQDKWGLRSQQRWAAAYEEGKYKVGEEIMALEIPQRKGDPIVFDRDEPPRKTSLEKLAKLRTIYGSPTVTAGNAPGMNAGGSAIVIMSRKKADKLGLEPLATIETMAWDAAEPRYMATLPAKAINRALSNANKSIDDLDLIEINEAFAAVTLVSLKALGKKDPHKYKALQEITNVNGGAIAVGHPVGASGARITMTLMYELMRRGGGCGVAAICGGLGQGESIILQV